MSIATDRATGRSAAAAYRKDTRGREQDPFSPHDGVWISVATMLQHAARTPEERGPLAQAALALARRVVGPAQPATDGAPEAANDTDDSVTILALANQIEAAGAIDLASSMLESFTAAVDVPLIDVGRVLARRARLLMKAGRLDASVVLCKQLARTGRQLESAELLARARIALGAIAQVNGDYDALARLSASAARLASKHHDRRLTMDAHNGLFIAAAMKGRLDQALAFGWKAFRLAATDAAETSETLTNLGQLLLDAGHAEAGRAAFMLVLSSHPVARIGLGALGGFAVASAHLGDERAVRWAIAETEREATTHAGLAVSVASAFLELATALTVMGDRRAALNYQNLANTIGLRHGFHAIAQTIPSNTAAHDRVEPRLLSSGSARIVRALVGLCPNELPPHVSFVSAA